MAKIRALEADHQTAAPSHDAVELLGRQWLTQGYLGPADVNTLRRHLDSLWALYTPHIAVEDQEVFPLAARLLSAGDVTAVGREMAARRGQPYERPGFTRPSIPLPIRSEPTIG